MPPDPHPTLDLPYIDEHAVHIAAAHNTVWIALQNYVEKHLLRGHGVLGTILGSDPPAGFAVASGVYERRLVLVGSHRFGDYRLTFELADAPRCETQLIGRTHAAFRGLHGRIYWALVIGSGAHRIFVRRMLRSVALRSTESAR